jgi:hypothetical protein
LCFDGVLARLCDQKPVDLSVLPEETVVALWNALLRAGKLTPANLTNFTACSNHSAVLERVAALRLRDPPPLIPDTRNRWLGDELWRRR